MRTQPIPHAYRAFFRQIGLDPDIDRIPSEEAAVARLLHGGFRSEDLIDGRAADRRWSRPACRCGRSTPSCVDAGGLGIRTSVAG